MALGDWLGAIGRVFFYLKCSQGAGQFRSGRLMVMVAWGSINSRDDLGVGLHICSLGTRLYPCDFGIGLHKLLALGLVLGMKGDTNLLHPLSDTDLCSSSPLLPSWPVVAT